MSHHMLKHRLLERLRELGLRIHSVEAALEAPHSPDWEEQAVEREGEDVLERLGISARQETAQILAALKRMAAGEYGLCATCGEAISLVRLQAVPTTALCRHCAGAASARPRGVAP